MPTVKLSYDNSVSVEKNVQAAFARLNWALGNLSSKNVKRIDTTETSVKSRDGETQIAGPLLMMYDKQTPPVLRLKMGYDAETGKFIFQMYDATGALTLSENDAGEAVFSGNIATLKDAYVGNNLYIGNMEAKSKTIYLFNNGLGNACLVSLDADGKLHIYNIGGGLEIISDGNMDFAGSSVASQVNSTTGIHGFSGHAMIINNDQVMFDGDKWGVFGKSDVQQTAANITMTTTQTAGATYTANEQNMLNNLKADVTQLFSTVNGMIDKLQLYGIFGGV
jgi:hypothetical protein